MKKLLLLALPVLLLAACAGHKTKSCAGKPHMVLTAEQKACLKKENCVKPESKDDKAAKDKFMQCKKKAFETCGIKKHAKKDGDKYACNSVDGKACDTPDEYASIDEAMELEAETAAYGGF